MNAFQEAKLNFTKKPSDIQQYTLVILYTIQSPLRHLISLVLTSSYET